MMPHGQGARARGGSDANIFVIRRPWRLAEALTLALARQGHDLRWTTRGPASANPAPPARIRRNLQRAKRRVDEKRDFQMARREAKRPAAAPIAVTSLSRQTPTSSTLDSVLLDGVLHLRQEEFALLKGVSKRKVISQAAQDCGISYSTLYWLLHGKRKRLSWRTAGLLRDALPPSEWAALRIHLWPRDCWQAYEGRAIAATASPHIRSY